MTSDPPGPFISPTFNRADAARNAALRENINDHISALGDAFAVVWREAIEEAAAVVDECNLEGPYQAIGAADRIRDLIDTPETIREEPSRAQDGEQAAAIPEEYTLGHVIWHMSEEGGGPDVGISIGLGGGKALWIGDITDREHLEATAPMGGPGGWWLMFYPDRVPFAKFTDAEAAREFSDHIESLARNAANTTPDSSRAPDRELLLALARLFEEYWCGNQNQNDRVLNAAVDNGLIVPTPDGRDLEITDFGRAALALVKETPDAG